MNTTTTLESLVTDEHKKQYEEQGFFVLENVVPAEHLELLREELQRYIDELDAEMDAEGVTKKGINHKGSRYFIAAYKKDRNPRLAEFLFSPLMRELCTATIGPEAYLFVEQYVVKAAETGMKFSWHQDGGYVGHDHKPYLSAWVTLDDVTIENGTVYMLPYEKAGSKDLIKHVKDPETNDMVGYYGEDPGVPVIVPAGSVACFSSTCFHRSGFNNTDKMRRVYLCQYSPEPIYNKAGTAPWNLIEPFPEAE